MFSCEFCETFKNTFFIEHLWATASWEIDDYYYRKKFVNNGSFILRWKQVVYKHHQNFSLT